MKTVVSAIVLLLGLVNCASADVAAIRQNLDRYWFYRTIQRTDFLEPGIGQGRSMPACWRNPDSAVIKWADATIDLGWYIGALATEHYMLSHPGLFPGYASGDSGAMNQVRNELYYALSAMDRVDAVAEASFNPSAPDTPGFFIRDDVPSTFYSYFPGMTTALSDFSNTVNIYDKEMSQDQVVHVLLGLSLVKKLIFSDLVVGGMNLRAAAIDRGADIVDWVHQADWIIKNPVTGTDVVRGEDARSFSTGFNKSVVYLTDGAVDFSGSISGLWAWVWSTLSSPSNPAYDNRNNRHMAMSLAATGNGWGDSDTLDALMSLADAYDWHAYVLLYATLYDPIPQSRPTWAGHQATVNGLVQTMLNVAPTNGTPHHPLDPSEYNTGWCSSRRFLQTLDAQNNGEGEFTVGEWYNGSDYLLLHNLFYIVTPSLWQDPSPPAQATNPNPANGATGVTIINPTLSWTAGSGATSHDVYFGTSNPPAFKQNQTDTTCSVGTLTYNTPYYWRIDEKNAGGTTTGTVWSFTTVPPPPDPVTNFNATRGDELVRLTWRTPVDADFTGTMIRYSTSSYPTSPTDGALAIDKPNSPDTTDMWYHYGLVNGTTYYYSAFAHDDVPNYSVAAQASATPSDTVPPGSVSGFFVVVGNEMNNLSWTNPSDSDFAGTKILCKTTGYPAHPTDGTVVYDAAGASCTHMGLSNGTTYYYAAFAHDEVPNYSSSAEASGEPIYFGPAQAKLCPDNTPMTLTVGTVSAVFGDAFYVQCSEAACGVSGVKIVKSGHGASLGDVVTGIAGTVMTDPANLERYIAAAHVFTNGSDSVTPRGVTNQMLGGLDWHYNDVTGAGQKGIADGIGLNNIGLLVRVWGKVTQRDTSGLQYFYIDDGSAIKDGTQTASVDSVGIRIIADPTPYPEGSYVTITGVSSCFKDGSADLRRQVLPTP